MSDPLSFRQLANMLESIPAGRQTIADLRSALPYKIPKTHINWELLSAIVAASLMPCGDLDQGTAMHVGFWRAWVRSRSPLYCLSNELLRQFQATDTDNLPRLVPDDWVPPLPLLCLCLPNNALIDTLPPTFQVWTEILASDS